MQISEEKGKNLVVGAVVAGVLLVLFLIVILIIQFVQIGVRNREKAEYLKEIERLEQQIATGQEDFAYYSSQLGLEKLAREYGFKYKTDK